MRLFDSHVAPLSGHATASVGHYDYLNRSEREDASRVRVLFEEFFSRYPVEHQPRLLGQFRSKDRIPHFSATFELVLHEMLIRGGATILAIDAPVANGKAPDYLVQTGDGARLYVEAACAAGASAEEAAGKTRYDDVMTAIDVEVSDNFFWNTDTRGVPTQPVKLSRLRAQLRAWASTLDYEAIVRGKVEELRYEEHSFEVLITAFPRSDRTKPPKRGLGIQFGDVHWGRPQDAVRDKLIEKANKYGDLDYPLVVAINALESMFDGDDMIDALFGDLVAIVNRETNAVRESREGNGVWWGPAGPRNDRLAAAVVVAQLSPWNLASRTLSMIRNPYVSTPSPTVPLAVREGVVADAKIEWVEGPSIGQEMGLDQAWPTTRQVQQIGQ